MRAPSGSPAPPVPVQQSLDDLGTPLADVTFCVLDLETTGGDPATCAITEIGAVKVRCGEVLGTFQTLVNPGQRIPRTISVLTGITEAMVGPAPPVNVVLPTFLEFLGSAVVVGHNIRFDVSFLDAALAAAERPRLEGPFVDTCALARRLVREEVPNCRLATLADRFRLPHRPSHRALDDALATCDLLHALLERAAAYGVAGLDDLVGLPQMGRHPQAAKLRLTSRLPRSPGVYFFRDARGAVLYVGKATNLRARVRSYFSTDDRRKIGPMLREAQAVDHLVCSSALEAAVVEARLLDALRPRYNRAGTRGDRAAYLRLDVADPFPRLVVGRSPRGSGPVLGPLPSAKVARLAAEAIESAIAIRRCATRLRPGRSVRDSPCTAAQLGVCPCPCAGEVDPASYRAAVATAVAAMTDHPQLVAEHLARRIGELAGAERFEEAALVRDRAAAFALAVDRSRRIRQLQRAGRMVVELPGGAGIEVRRGVVVASWEAGALPGPVGAGSPSVPPAPEVPEEGATTPGAASEMLVVASHLSRYAARLRLAELDGELSSPLPALPSFRPR